MEKKSNKKNKLEFPDFNKMTYAKEAEWWDSHDLGDYWNKMKDVDIVVELQKPKDDTVVVRLQKDFKNKLEETAKSKGLNVSTLARIWLMEKLQASRS